MVKPLQGSWSQESQPKEGQLRVWCIINPPSAAYFHDVQTPEEARDVINREADIQLKIPAVQSNAFGLEVYKLPGEFGAGGWEEWEDASGYSIDETEEV